MYIHIKDRNLTDKRLANMILHSSFTLMGTGDYKWCNRPSTGLRTTLFSIHGLQMPAEIVVCVPLECSAKDLNKFFNLTNITKR